MSDPRITDEAVEAALDVLMDDGHNGLQCDPTRNFELSVRAALDAALPHLLASLCTCPTDADVTPDMRTETGQHLSGCPTLGGEG